MYQCTEKQCDIKPLICDDSIGEASFVFIILFTLFAIYILRSR